MGHPPISCGRVVNATKTRTLTLGEPPLAILWILPHVHVLGGGSAPTLPGGDTGQAPHPARRGHTQALLSASHLTPCISPLGRL